MLIVQAFNQPFGKVQSSLPRLRKLGFTHVLVSPPQKSHASRCWWARYQPVDYCRIEGPLGTAEQLQRLCQEALRQGLAIVVDAVLHHLSNESHYLRVHGRRILEARYPRFSQADLRGLHSPGRGKGLPILETRSPWVRRQLRDYLHMLFDLGVRGFRFDSAKHLDPHLFPELLGGLPPLLCFGELVYLHARDFPAAYWQSMMAYDFPLAHSLRKALAPGGDLGSLIRPESLWGPHSIPFVNHHDLVKHPARFRAFRIEDAVDRQLAHVYLLNRNQGIPLIYSGDLRHSLVKASLEFRLQHRGHAPQWLAATRQALAWRCGTGLAAINKGAQPWRCNVHLPSGRYRELTRGVRYDWPGGELSLVTPARGSTLLTPF